MFKFIAGILFLFLVACSDSNSSASSNSHAGEKLDDFIHMPAAKSAVILGSNSEKAPAIDRPQMNVNLDYDFYFARHEVSCDEYAKYMDLPEDSSCSGNYVVTGMTYYDAVLYANARSKAEKMDTVYTYARILRDAQGACINLVGLQFNPEKEGYRLPTEAEWVYAFSELYNPDSLNDDFTVYAKEWVNDWLGSLRDTIVTNYIGAPNGGALDEHVVKGGSYNSMGQLVIDFSSRGDIYRVSASSRAHYIGFRLAYGKIPSAFWMNSQGSSVHNSQSILTTPQDVHHAVGSYRVKLAYRDNVSGHLVVLDFNNGKPMLVEMDDTLSVFHPDISPDGKWIAFSTGTEGISGNSQVYVLQFGSTASLSKLDVENAAIPRFHVAADGDTVIVYVTDSGNNTNENEFLSHSTWQVPFSKGTFGKPQKLFDGAYHGGISPDESLAVSGARLLRVRKGNSHRVWYDSLQACNVSLSQDGSNRTLFLDFGGKTGRKFAGMEYGAHEQILIADSTGTLIQSIPAPEGFAFDHTEWVGETNYVVATLSNFNGAHEKIVVVNLSDSSITDLVGGEDVYHPVLWISDGLKNVNLDKSLDPDSAGIYFGNRFLQEDVMWRYKMELMWKYKDSADMVVVGSSRPLNGIRPRIMSTPKLVANLAQTPNSIFTSRDFVKNYVFPHFRKMKYLVVSLDIDFWWKADDHVDNFFAQTYKDYPGFVYDENHHYWQDGYPEGLYELTTYAPGTDGGSKYYTGEDGFLGENCADWGDSIPSASRDTLTVEDSLLLEKSYKALEEIVGLAKKNDVVVIGAIFPMSPAYKNTGAYGRHGVRRSLAIKMIDRLKKMESENFILMDENKMGEHDYGSSKASNFDHLCYGGAKQFTSRLDSLIATLE